MAIYPGAIRKLIPKHNQRRIVRYRRMNLHVAVSEAASLHGFFSGAAVCSHFYVRKDGTVEQYIDTIYESHADLHGNDSTISVETQGGLRNANGEPWTQAQVIALTNLWKWARDTHGIANKLATGTETNEASAGLSWHRLGVRGFGRTVNILYSKAYRKICPGDAKIAQIPEIFNLANVSGGGGTSKPTPTPTPKPKPKPTTLTYAELLVDGHRGTVTNKAWQTLLKAAGFYPGLIDGHFGPMSTRSEQTWLAALGYYKRAIDGQRGPWTVRALQSFLRGKGLYGTEWLIDGVEGPATVKAEQRYLNTQNDF